jgi:uncharacterized damage-inducible protein DinB
MIDPAYVQRMARYNAWQNESLYGAAGTLSDAERRRNRGAFFGSIHGTLNHLVWADRMWMSRWCDVEKIAATAKQSADLFDWETLKAQRATLDARILTWANEVDAAWLAGDMTWFSGVAQRDVTEARWLLLTHLFNHQTHHRGQVHAMLTQAGTKPAETDLWLMPERFVELATPPAA